MLITTGVVSHPIRSGQIAGYQRCLLIRRVITLTQGSVNIGRMANASPIKANASAHLRQLLWGDGQIGQDDLFVRQVNSLHLVGLSVNRVRIAINSQDSEFSGLGYEAYVKILRGDPREVARIDLNILVSVWLVCMEQRASPELQCLRPS